MGHYPVAGTHPSLQILAATDPDLRWRILDGAYPKATTGTTTPRRTPPRYPARNPPGLRDANTPAHRSRGTEQVTTRL